MDNGAMRRPQKRLFELSEEPNESDASVETKSLYLKK